MYHEIDRALYLVAAMTGLRLGELLALRWRDVDWIAGVIRVRRNYVRGRYGTPKSRRSSRAVPMADERHSLVLSHFLDPFRHVIPLGYRPETPRVWISA